MVYIDFTSRETRYEMFGTASIKFNLHKPVGCIFDVRLDLFNNCFGGNQHIQEFLKYDNFSSTRIRNIYKFFVFILDFRFVEWYFRIIQKDIRVKMSAKIQNRASTYLFRIYNFLTNSKLEF